MCVCVCVCVCDVSKLFEFKRHINGAILKIWACYNLTKWNTSVTSKITTTHSMNPRKTQRDAEWDGQVLEDSSRGLNTASICQLTELKQTKEWERYPNRFRRLYETLHVKSLSRMVRVRDQASHSGKQQTSRPHSVN